jgi:hypothetical protein
MCAMGGKRSARIVAVHVAGPWSRSVFLMPRLDTLKVNEVLAVIGVLTGFLGAATAIVTARWNRRAVLSEEAIAALKQQMDLIKQQATQTGSSLRTIKS